MASHHRGKEAAAGPSRSKCSCVQPAHEGPFFGGEMAESEDEAAEAGSGYYGQFSSSGDGKSHRGSFTAENLANIQRSVQDTPILRNLCSHPSVYLRAQKVPPSRPYRGAWFLAVTACQTAHESVRIFLDDHGFREFLRITPFRSRHSLVQALADCWFSETNTFHLGDCELGVMPLDWAVITGIRFGGDPVRCLPSSVTSADVTRVLGINSNVIKEHRLSASALRGEDGFFRSVLGWFGTSNVRVDFPDGSVIDWGSFTFGTFLQAMRRRWWSFEHMDVARPRVERGIDTFPRALRWIRPRARESNLSDFVTLRTQLEVIEPDHIDWLPFENLVEAHNLRAELVLSRSQRPFFSCNSWELYMGEQCWRQLMGNFAIPVNPPRVTFGQRDSRFTSLARVVAGPSVGVEQVRYFQRFGGNPDMVSGDLYRQVLAERDYYRWCHERAGQAGPSLDSRYPRARTRTMIDLPGHLEGPAD
ncbi:hypothetical protein RHSIM_Rhsim12G0165100 [Rhododendron simsii]|uniref:Aminotransferase-like plant mobile domain-containing protein n=1 Tax=Rhododendron simsii TaxID=118357 RepID=A0A834G3G4_RHOSS|nr:hypothetical protein RHSIM_Rhsim12G0165100 [Rhododendron simsii]